MHSQALRLNTDLLYKLNAMQANNQLRPSEQLLYSTVKIESTMSDGDVSTGTGFLFRFSIDGKFVPVIVTNKHVIQGGISARFSLNQADQQGKIMVGQPLTIAINNLPSAIIEHPSQEVDLCIIPIAPFFNEMQQKNLRPFAIFLDSTIIPSDQQWNELSALEEIIMIGYPNGIWDSTNNLPVIRQGVTATHPKFDYCGKKEFLIDAAVFPGSSGSPVFIYNEGSYPVPSGIALGTRVLLLGVGYAVYQHTTTGEIEVQDIPTHNKAVAISRIPNNLGLVIKSSRLKEFEPILQNLIANPPVVKEQP